MSLFQYGSRAVVDATAPAGDGAAVVARERGAGDGGVMDEAMGRPERDAVVRRAGTRRACSPWGATNGWNLRGSPGAATRRVSPPRRATCGQTRFRSDSTLCVSVDPWACVFRHLHSRWRPGTPRRCACCPCSSTCTRCVLKCAVGRVDGETDRVKRGATTPRSSTPGERDQRARSANEGREGARQKGPRRRGEIDMVTRTRGITLSRASGAPRF